MSPALTAALERLRRLAIAEADAKAYALVARACAALPPSLELLSEMSAQQAEILATVAPFFNLRPYVRHLESCGGWTPCSCGLTALVADV